MAQILAFRAGQALQGTSLPFANQIRDRDGERDRDAFESSKGKGGQGLVASTGPSSRKKDALGPLNTFA